MGGATNIGHFVSLFGPGGFGVRLTGLCDQGEERDFRRGLDRVGPYFVCVADLEDELIRALGTSRVEDLIEAEGESGPFRTFTRQPAHRGEGPRPAVAPLHGHPLRPEDPLRPRPRRRARPDPDPRARWRACCPRCDSLS